MSMQERSVFWVNVDHSPALIKVRGRACYLNAAPLSAFLERYITEGVTQFVFDLGDCIGMDSTFMGILAGAAVELKASDVGGEVVLMDVNEDHLRLVTNLGLHKILSIQANAEVLSRDMVPIEQMQSCSREILEKAHLCLMEINDANRDTFRDVVSFLQESSD